MEHYMMKILTIMLLVFILGCTRNDERTSIQDVVDVQKIELTQDERAWIRRNPIVRWSVEKNRPPYLWHDESTSFGISSDYIHIISKKTGLQFVPVFKNTLNDSLRAIQLGEVDLITALRPTPGRAGYLRFSPVFAFTNTVLVFNSEKTNVPIKMGVVEGAAAYEYIKARFPKMEIIAFTNDAESLKALQRGIVGASIMDYYTYAYLSKILNVDFMTTPVDFDYTPALAYRDDTQILGSIITKAVASVTFEERTIIIKRWIK